MAHIHRSFEAKGVDGMAKGGGQREMRAEDHPACSGAQPEKLRALPETSLHSAQFDWL